MTTEDTNNLIKTDAFDIISMTTIWSLVNSSHSYLNHSYLNHSYLNHSHLNHSHFYIESKYIDFSLSVQDINKLVAYGTSAFMLTKYFHS